MYIVVPKVTEVSEVYEALVAAGARVALVVCEEGRLIGVCTQGDIIRLKSRIGHSSVVTMMNVNFIYATNSESRESLVRRVVEGNLTVLPVLNPDGTLLEVVTPWKLLEQSL